MLSRVQEYLKKIDRVSFIFAILFFAAFLLLYHFLAAGETGNAIYGYLIVSLVYAAFIFFLLKKKKFSLRSSGSMLLILCALFVRLLFFAVQPEVLSDDLYRYVWDGKVQASGINPYLYPPNHPDLQSIRDKTIYPKINHKQMRTIYPPLAQLLFRGAYAVGQGSLLPLRLLNLFFDIVCAFFLWLFIQNKKILLFYLLSPLLIIESYVGVHIDIVGASLLMGALTLFKREHFRAAFLLLSSAILVKYVAVVVAPLFLIEYFRHTRSKGNGIWDAVARTLEPLFFMLLPLLFFLPYLSAGKHLFSQLFAYNRYWQFNGFLYKVAQIFMAEPRVVTQILSMALFLIIYIKRAFFTQRVFLALLVLLLLFPVLYPWYLLWVLPIALALLHFPFLLLSVLIFISYAIVPGYRSTGVWQEKAIILLVQYLPFYGALLFYYWRRRCVQKREDRVDHSLSE